MRGQKKVPLQYSSNLFAYLKVWLLCHKSGILHPALQWWSLAEETKSINKVKFEFIYIYEKKSIINLLIKYLLFINLLFRAVFKKK